MANEKRLIDANALIDKHTVLWDEALGFCACVLVEDIDNAPTIDAVEVAHGRWREKILVGGFAEEWGYVCSECGCTVSDRSNLRISRYASKNQRLNYCPNCGAKMDGDGDA
jgi:DNA-directed RNA polymerase subunit RPC12/RpoP